MAATFFTLAVSFGAAAFAVWLANPEWARDHAWLGPWLSGAAVMFLLFTAASILWRRSKKPPISQLPVPAPAQQTQGHSSPNIIATHGASVNVDFGVQPKSEPENRPFIRPVEYCERVNGEFLRVINEGGRSYGIYTEPLVIGEWVLNFDRPTDLSGEGQINVLRLSKTNKVDDRTTDISTLQKLEHAWLQVERANPNFTKPWIRIHYHDRNNRRFLSQCRIVRFRDVTGNTSFRLTNFTDMPEEVA